MGNCYLSYIDQWECVIDENGILIVESALLNERIKRDTKGLGCFINVGFRIKTNRGERKDRLWTTKRRIPRAIYAHLNIPEKE